ncbi:MAG: hypothetical protein M5U28_17615 [Sandaracinaceae bacterium]|nr:hypothetical protein [Sandaracinaceae bacterium]
MTAAASSTASLSRVASVLALPVRAADRARWVWLRALGPLSRPLVRRRELRVAVAGSSMLLVALALTALAPLWLLALGPIVWGPARAERRALPLGAARARQALGALAGRGRAARRAVDRLRHDVGAPRRRRRGALRAWALWRKLVVLAALAPLAYGSRLEPFLAAVIFAHAHNFIGVALFWSWRRREGRLHFAPLLVFAAGCAAILAGALDPIVLSLSGLDARPGGMDVYYHLASLAPGVPGMLSVRLVLLFAFAQAAHYVVWVRLVPEEDRPRETPRTFAASLRVPAGELGWPLVVLTTAAALGLAVWAALDLFAARTGYLRAVLFHGHLEVAAAALLFVAGTRPRASTEGA